MCLKSDFGKSNPHRIISDFVVKQTVLTFYPPQAGKCHLSIAIHVKGANTKNIK